VFVTWDPDEAERVKAFLMAHPEMLRQDPDVLALLGHEADTSGQVVDMAAYARDRLSLEVARLRGERAEWLTIARDNTEARRRAQEAVLKLIAARDFEDVVRIAARGLAPVLKADASVFAVEAQADEEGLAGVAAGGVRVVTAGEIDRLLGHGVRAVTRHIHERSRDLFGEQGEDLRSEAIVRLTFSDQAPPGLLALGSRDPDLFAPGQDLELLEFLAAALETSVRTWLDLPPPKDLKTMRERRHLILAANNDEEDRVHHLAGFDQDKDDEDDGPDGSPPGAA
jgi:hypothetical protein